MVGPKAVDLNRFDQIDNTLKLIKFTESGTCPIPNRAGPIERFDPILKIMIIVI